MSTRRNSSPCDEEREIAAIDTGLSKVVAGHRRDPPSLYRQVEDVIRVDIESDTNLQDTPHSDDDEEDF
jgi:hypothetical protein